MPPLGKALGLRRMVLEAFIVILRWQIIIDKGKTFSVVALWLAWLAAVVAAVVFWLSTSLVLSVWEIMVGEESMQKPRGVTIQGGCTGFRKEIVSSGRPLLIIYRTLL